MFRRGKKIQDLDEIKEEIKKDTSKKKEESKIEAKNSSNTKKDIGGVVKSENLNKSDIAKLKSSVSTLKKEIEKLEDERNSLEDKRLNQTHELPRKMIIAKKRRSTSFGSWLFNNRDL